MTERMTVAHAAVHRGCWIEGSRGWTGPGALVCLAQDLGMLLDTDDLLIVAAFFASIERVTLTTGEDVDVTDCVIGQGELADKAEEFLNEHIAPEGWAFGWCDCEFFLWPDEVWAEGS